MLCTAMGRPIARASGVLSGSSRRRASTYSTSPCCAILQHDMPWDAPSGGVWHEEQTDFAQVRWNTLTQAQQT
jgi:hypothetical protein